MGSIFFGTQLAKKRRGGIIFAEYLGDENVMKAVVRGKKLGAIRKFVKEERERRGITEGSVRKQEAAAPMGPSDMDQPPYTGFLYNYLVFAPEKTWNLNDKEINGVYAELPKDKK